MDASKSAGSWPSLVADLRRVVGADVHANALLHDRIDIAIFRRGPHAHAIGHAFDANHVYAVAWGHVLRLDRMDRDN